MTFGISIVTGTFQRLELLKAMIASVRRSLHRGIPHEFIICDGGSRDGTLDWLREQPDVVLLADGELRGAISAFTRAAYSAQFDYVMLANDDIQVFDSSILRAIAYLEETPTCGAVAFADDRRAVGKPDGFGVQTMSALQDGKQVHVPYAQVGLFRRFLGDMAGWWGADDPDFHSHTYGGDNYLTARILEFGYSVDAVAGVRVKDLVANDGLRQHNITREENLIKSGGGYYQRYPAPPRIEPLRAFDCPQDSAGRERLRIIYLPIFETRSYPHHPLQKRGLRDALGRLGQVIEIDYLNEPFDLCEVVYAWQPHILVSQCQRDKLDIAAARKYQPNMLCLNWNGDVYLDAMIDDATLNWYKAGNADVALVVNAAALPVYDQHGIKAAYWQCGYEPVTGATQVGGQVDVVFIGSAYSDARHRLAKFLTALPYSVQLIGSGWVDYPKHNGGNTTYEFELSSAIRRIARIEVGDNQYLTDSGFVSNRMFDCLAAGGALLLHQHVPELEAYTGLQAGVHYVEWSDYADLNTKITYYLTHEKERARIVKQGAVFVRKHHSFDARIDELFHEILPRVL